MKRVFTFLLAIAMLVCLCACGDKAESKKDTKTTTKATTTSTTVEDGDATTTTTADESDVTTTDSLPSDTTGGPTITDGTTAPSGTTATTQKPQEEPQKSFRLLTIGDGMALDAVQTHLYNLLKGAGYTDIYLGILHAEGTVDTYYEAVNKDSKSFTYHQNNNGKWTKETKVAPSKAFKAADWDYVVLQQSAASSGVDTAYGKLGSYTAAVQKQCANASIYWHMTWSFQQGSKQEGFQNYYNNQQVMFQNIISTTLKRVMMDENVMGLIPTATTIQNLRTSTLKDALTTDGKHLVDGYGDYAAALTFFCCLTDSTPADTTYRPSSVTGHIDEIVEAVENALSVPNDITPAAKGDGVDRSISILAVGNSFSVDAMTNHLYQILQAAGYDNIRFGILYVGGCSLDMHYNYLSADSASYEYMENTTGKWNNTKDYKASTAFALTDWDYVVVQQVSGSSGLPGTYGKLDALVDIIRPQIGDAKLYWQMTWAYQQDSTHHDFKNYNSDQMTMYNAIISTVKEKIANNPDFAGVIPSGTAIQNLRTSSLGDTLTADGYHLENTIGDYTAAMTWFATLTGNDPFSAFYFPSGTAEHFYEIADAVENAVANPWQVTNVTA